MAHNAKILMSAVMALMALTGCSTVHRWTAPSAPVPAAAASAAPAASAPAAAASVPAPAASSAKAVAAAPAASAPVVQKEKVLGDFPTSKNPAKGRAWDTMHENGYTGGYEVATCNVLGLTRAKCALYKRMHSDGTCVTMEVTNGVILDALTFTSAGKHFVQRQVKVGLKNPMSRKAEVCELGDGVVAMRFHGCNNHGLVRSWTQPLWKEVDRVLTPTPVAAQQCSEPPYVQLNIWGVKAFQVAGVAEMVAATRADTSGYYVPNRVSRTFGATFRAMHGKGELARSKQAHDVTIMWLHADGKETFLDRRVALAMGELRFATPSGFADGDAISFRFGDQAKLASPPISDLRIAWKEFVRTGCGQTTHIHAIDAK